MRKDSSESLGSAGDEGKAGIPHIRTLGRLTSSSVALEAAAIAAARWCLGRCREPRDGSASERLQRPHNSQVPRWPPSSPPAQESAPNPIACLTLRYPDIKKRYKFLYESFGRLSTCGWSY